MDGASQDVAAFLGTLQDAMQRLGALWGHYLRRGTRPGRPILTLSGRPFTAHEAGNARQFAGCVTLALPVTGSDSKEYELTVDILWDERCWTISTEAWVEADDGGQRLLRQLTERSATDLGTCLVQVIAAIEDLVSFEDLVPRG
jgi:hypothetical protein